MNQQDVVALTELSWGFDGDGPRFSTSHNGTWACHHKADPTPAYAHDVDAVRAELSHLQRVAPLRVPLRIFVLNHELLGRTNAFHMGERGYDPQDSSTNWPVSTIVLSGKRIPIHPAMTRYLVAHEYGHAVEDHITRLRNVGKTKQRGIIDEYVRDVRPDALRSDGPGKWHTNAGELFANDFRILIAKRELEFWPHPGFSRPEDTLAAVGWWSKVREELWDNFSTVNECCMAATDGETHLAIAVA